jgi:tight adherence protein B
VILLAALSAGLALVLWWGAPAATLLERIRPSTASRVRSGRPGMQPAEIAGALARVPASVIGVVAAGSVIGGLALGGWNGGLRALLVTEALVVAVRAVDARTRRRAAVVRDEQWQEACEILATELRAGRSAEQAVTTAALACPDLQRAVRALHLGGDVVAGLRLIGDAPAAAGLASAWATASASGAGLAGVVERVTDELVAQLDLRREIDSQLAAPRATARLLALLPLGGMALGVFLGVDPLGMLLGTTVGLCCLVIGSALALAGVVWVDRLARSATVTG